MTQVSAALYRELANVYPPEARQRCVEDAERLAFQATLLAEPGKVFVDVGSGLSPLALGLRKMGMRALMIDRFDYPAEMGIAADVEQLLGTLRAQGVEVCTADVVRTPLPLGDAAVDALACVAMIEHLHQSPQPLFTEFFRILKPGGKLLIGCPNAVNLRKRISVLLGKNNQAPIGAFWKDGHPVWLGHVREPTLADMLWMTRAAGFVAAETWGRNFIGAQRFGILAAGIDPLLRLFPGLCSDIYVLARRP